MQTANEAFFGGQLFVRAEDNVVMTCLRHHHGRNVVCIVTAEPVPLDGAYIARQRGRWVFVGGRSQVNGGTQVFYDTCSARAAELSRLGIPLIAPDDEVADRTVRP